MRQFQPPAPGYRPIADYALIGDCRSAALVSREGSIDWLCLPRFDSPAVFAAILDARRGGRFRVAPVGAARVSRRYIGLSNVLETTFETDDGIVRLTDAMPVADEKTKTRALWPDHEVLRRVECVEGRATVEALYEPRPDYGRARPRLRPGAHGTIHCEHGTEVLILRSDIPLKVAADGASASGRRELARGERAILGLSFAHQLPAVYPAHGACAEGVIEGSIRWWETWASTCTYDWKHRDAILRSALALKMLTYAPSGAMVAAPTASLPEKIGGVRNWDYRYCWLRDASLTLRALVDLGFSEEGEAFLSWVLHATRLTQPKLQVLYDVYGEVRVHEQDLEHLDGYAGSRPVHIGNGAAGQLQLDVYGEVVEAAYQYVVRGGSLDRSTGGLLAGLGRTVCSMWREPDEGIWEPRAGRRQNSHSKMMCWLALDRLIRMREEGRLRVPLDGFRETRDAIAEEIESRGWSAEAQSYTAVLDGTEVDAALLRFALSGYADPAGARMQRTVRRIEDRLGAGGGLLYRYLMPDGLPPGEGAFLICGFWAVECQALAGRLREAEERFERLMDDANDVGLLSEEIDPASGAMLGNFPQAFSHIGLINAALTLAECAGHSQAAQAKSPGRHKP
jgi:GH15 family glucan-1,4-alpha-glucosidase